MADTACSLEQALGHLEPCPGPACSFWLAERGEDHCVLEGVEGELLARPAVAAHLLVLRRDMDEAARLHRALTSSRPGSPMVAVPSSKRR